MKIPTYLKNKLKAEEDREKKEQAEEIKQKRRYNKLLKDYAQREKKNYPAKVELCKKIFAWLEEFLTTKEGKKLFKITEGDIWIYCGGWGHGYDESEVRGRCADIYFDGKEISYQARYKWMGVIKTMYFSKPEEMAKKMNYKYLNKLWKALASGEVFEDIPRLNDLDEDDSNDD